MTPADRHYRTEVGDVVVDGLGERRQVVQVTRAEDIRISDTAGFNARTMEVNALWAGSGQRRGPLPPRW